MAIIAPLDFALFVRGIEMINDYEKSKTATLKLLTLLVNTYFKRIDKEKVSAEEAFEECPNFIKDIWHLRISKFSKDK